MPAFKLDSVFTPTADQPAAIDALADGVRQGERFQTLLGASWTAASRSSAEIIVFSNPVFFGPSIVAVGLWEVADNYGRPSI